MTGAAGLGVFFLVPYVPTRIRTRPYNLLRGLVERGHTVTLATLWQNDEEKAALREWETLGVNVIAAALTSARSLWNAVSALPGSAPLQASYCWQPALLHQIDMRLASARPSVDVVHVEHLRGARYGLHLTTLHSQFPGRRLPIVWDSVDCISYLFEQAAGRSASSFGRIVTRLDLGRTRRYEAWLAGQFDRVLVTSAVDKSAFEQLSSAAPGRLAAAARPRIAVLPNGVDLAYFQPGAGPRLSTNIVFSGKMSYHANVTAVLYFARQVLPLIWSRRPEATLTIAGHAPPAEVRRLARDSRITVTGSVPDIRPYLQRATVAVAPMPYGAGIQNKVLEAMACATPVVATAQAVAALHEQAGEHLLVAESGPDLADAVIRVLNDASRQHRMGLAGRRYVEEHHNWMDIVNSLEVIYHDVIAQ